MAARKLTLLQAAGLRTDLDAVTQQVLTVKKHGLAVPYYEQVAVVAVHVDIIGRKLNEMVGYSLVQPIVEKSRFIAVNGDIIQLDRTATHRAELERKTVSAATTGSGY